MVDIIKSKYNRTEDKSEGDASNVPLTRRNTRPKRCVWISAILIILTGLVYTSSISHEHGIQLPQIDSFSPGNGNAGGFSNALTYINKTREMLVKYYGGEEGDLLGAFLGSQHVDKLIDVLTQKFTYSLINRKKLVFAMIGSSVMAGHDNCHYDSYPEQLYRMLKPIFEGLDYDVEVNNAGIQGTCGDSFVNRVWCLEHLVGDADTVHGVWIYFGWKGNPKNMEAYIRWALMGGTIPTIISGGGRLGLEEHYGPLGYQTFQYNYYLRKNGGSEQWGHQGDGVHNTTRYGELPGVTPERKNSLAVNFRNWHPGPLTFQYDSDAFFYVYSEAIYRALIQIREMSSEQMQDFPQPTYMLPNPIHLKDGDIFLSESRPHCRVGEEPAFGESSIQVEGGNRYFGGFEYKVPRDEAHLPECRHIDRCGGWRIGKDKISATIPKLTKGLIFLCGLGQPEKIMIGEDLAFINVTKEFHDGSPCAKVEKIPQSAFEKEFQLHIYGGNYLHDFIAL